MYLYFMILLCGLANYMIAMTGIKWSFSSFFIVWFSLKPFPILLNMMGIPVVFFLFVDQMFDRSVLRCKGWLWRAYAVCGTALLLLYVIDLIRLPLVIFIFVTSVLIGLSYVLSCSLAEFTRLTKDGKWFVAGLCMMFIGSMHDTLVLVQIIRQGTLISHWGTAGLIFSVLVIFGRQWMERGVKEVNLKGCMTIGPKEASTALSVTSIVNHSIKNEMNKIQYLADQLKKALGDLPYGTASQSVDELYRITNHVQEMVNKIRQFSADIVLHEEAIEMDMLVDEALLLIQPYAEQHRVQMVKSTDLHQQKLIVRCDSVYVKDCMVNLCFNAIEAMKPDMGLLQVRIAAYKKGAMIEFRDNGTGILPTELARIQEPFYTTKKKSTHFGLGLSYCQQVMAKHDGQLKVESQYGVGTSVALYFPKSRTRLVHLNYERSER
ncbi:ATP-binding protein [Paenibacillus taiwanensis]|uniref:ATP-binding protein n=1 Tax=Paenibacillus taiwanensis TaxID=401638 RepID=UPI00041C105D